MNRLSTIFSNASIVIFVTGSLGIISMLVNIIIARELNVTLYGQYSIFISVGSILGIFMEGGAKHLIQRNISINKSLKENNIIFSTLILVSTKNICFIFICTSIISFFFLKHIFFEVVLMCICFSLTSLYQMFSYYLKGQQNFVIDSYFNIFNRFLSGICIVMVLLIFDGGIKGIFLAWSFPILVLIILLVKLNKIKFSIVGNSKNYSKKSLIPLLLNDINLLLVVKLDIIYMSIINFSNKEIGLFSAGLKIVEIIIILMIPTSIVLFKEFEKELKENFKLPLFTISSVVLSLVVGLAFCFFVNNYTSELINLIFGSDYLDSQKYVRLLSYLPMLLIPNLIMFQAILASKNEFNYCILLLFSLVIHLVLNFYFNYDNVHTFSLYGIYTSQIITFTGSIFIIFKKNKIFNK